MKTIGCDPCEMQHALLRQRMSRRCWPSPRSTDGTVVTRTAEPADRLAYVEDGEIEAAGSSSGIETYMRARCCDAIETIFTRVLENQADLTL